jgi:hypothetical protein
MTFDASGHLTGVEAVQTGPVQWLNTMVEEVGCQVTRRLRSCVVVRARARPSSAVECCRVRGLPGGAGRAREGLPGGKWR